MEIQETITDNTAVLILHNRMVNRRDVAPFKAHIRDLAKRGISHVEVDVSGVIWFGAAMVGALVEGAATLRSVGGELRLVGANKWITRILMATRLHQVFGTGLPETLPQTRDHLQMAV